SEPPLTPKAKPLLTLRKKRRGLESSLKPESGRLKSDCDRLMRREESRAGRERTLNGPGPSLKRAWRRGSAGRRSNARPGLKPSVSGPKLRPRPLHSPKPKSLPTPMKKRGGLESSLRPESSRLMKKRKGLESSLKPESGRLKSDCDRLM